LKTAVVGIISLQKWNNDKPMMECLLAIMEKFKAKIMAKLDAYQGKMDGYLEELKDN
jgi:hypothetical protein